MGFCFNCCQEFDGEYDVCPKCGTVRNTKPKQPMELRPGTELGPNFEGGKRYIIDTAVGEGGFGIVYRAWDRKLKVIIAIKEFFSSKFATRETGKDSIVIPEQNMDEFEYRRERFLAEAQYMAKFTSHESIVNVYDCFEENNTLYLTMELLEGENLDKYLSENNGKLAQDKIIKIVHEVCNALDSMHKEGIVHRDVSPSNIFLCDSGKIKLLDIGSAKLAGIDDDVVDAIVKPGYTPPEQYDGKSDNIGPYTDIYAFAATIYRCLVGQRPCESISREPKDILASPHSVDGKISRKTSNVIMKAMSLDIDSRYANATEFKDDFDNAVEKSKRNKTVTIKYYNYARREFFLAALIGAGFGVINEFSFVGNDYSIITLIAYFVLAILVSTLKRKAFFITTVALTLFSVFSAISFTLGLQTPLGEQFYDLDLFLSDSDIFNGRASVMMLLFAIVMVLETLLIAISFVNKKVSFELRKIFNVFTLIYVLLGLANDALYWFIWNLSEGVFTYSDIAIKLHDIIGEEAFYAVTLIVAVFPRIFAMAGFNDAIKWLCLEDGEKSIKTKKKGKKS